MIILRKTKIICTLLNAPTNQRCLLVSENDGTTWTTRQVCKAHHKLCTTIESNDNNECTANVEVPGNVKDLMLKVIETEPVEQVKNVFKQIYMLVCAGGILFPPVWDKTIEDLKVYAETLN